MRGTAMNSFPWSGRWVRSGRNWGQRELHLGQLFRQRKGGVSFLEDKAKLIFTQ